MLMGPCRLIKTFQSLTSAVITRGCTLCFAQKKSSSAARNICLPSGLGIPVRHEGGAGGTDGGARGITSASSAAGDDGSATSVGDLGAVLMRTRKREYSTALWSASR